MRIKGAFQIGKEELFFFFIPSLDTFAVEVASEVAAGVDSCVDISTFFSDEHVLVVSGGIFMGISLVKFVASTVLVGGM